METQLLVEKFKGRGPLVHVVLDGWGVAPEGPGNAIGQANLPLLRKHSVLMMWNMELFEAQN